MDAVSHLLRRRAKRGAFAASPHFAVVDPIPDQNETRAIQAAGLRKRLTPAEIEAMQASARSSAIRAASDAAAATTAKTTATQRVATPAAQTPTTTTHSAWVFSDKFGHVTTPTTTPAATVSSAVRAVTSSTSSSTVRASSSSASSSAAKSSSSSTSTTTTRSSTAAPLTSTATIRTITQSTSSSVSSSSSAPSVSSDANLAGANSTKDTGISGGTIAGIIVGALVGIVIVGSLIGWLYRKHKNRSYSDKAPWAKIDDDDITPYPPGEKYGHHGGQDDIYGASAAPVIGSRRALAMARQNAFQEDGSFRPASDYMFTEEGPNRAGVGSGGSLSQGYSAYPNLPSPYYGLDPQGRPYHPDADHSPMSHMYNNLGDHSPHALTAPGNTRQLVGPHGFPQPDLSPHALGRPAAPVSNFAIAQHEDFADMPEPHTPTNVDHGDLPYTPRTAMSAGEWAGDARLPQDRSRVSMSTPKAMGPGEAAALAAATAAARGPSQDEKAFPVPQPTTAAFPSFEPMSPLMAEFDLKRSSSQPLAMYEDERSQQKRMYGEVASAANVPEPPTPKSAINLTHSTSSADTGSSFSATEPMPARLPPAIAVQAPQPYIHGRPLSPLAEVQTPMSVATRPSMDYPVPSSSLLHEQNPYERTLLAAKAVPGSPAPPYSASSAGVPALASPAYPQRRMSGMSVPGSVTDSPQQWGRSETKGTRVQSMFDEEDAYGGI